MTGIPSASCGVCGHNLRPHEVLLGRCPSCGEPITYLVVDRATAREIHDADVVDAEDRNGAEQDDRRRSR